MQTFHAGILYNILYEEENQQITSDDSDNDAYS